MRCVLQDVLSKIPMSAGVLLEDDIAYLAFHEEI